ncbi:MAG: Type I restriction-modification system, specificity subunit S (EC [uncultured Sulfurovum sp.]|uniref:Type I restriction-modification system, specificity subunit S (EC) n=1 Tax=uncultured Sulfurovum sp. TaxID=269237 RepID=A0A6S6SDD5_9BACT|nr:MAG: Type I restriction-modification system, specificity subunit S (EC [uncultured Sulfurovum sp.]
MREGWEVKSIGDVCTVIAGQSPKSSFYNNDGDGLPFYQGKKLFGNKFISSPNTWTTKITKEALKDDILMSVRAPVGPINFATERICIGRGLAAIRAEEKINKEYLFYFLMHNENEIIGNTGAVFNSINKKQIGDLKILMPATLPEQTEIVNTLDKAFAQIDQAKANLEKNLHNAQELFQSKLNEVFSQRGEGWVEKKLGEIASVEYGFTAKSTAEGTFRYVRITDIDTKGNLILDDKKYIEATEEASKFQLKENDILMARTGATFGKVLLYKDYEPSVFASYLIRIHFTENISNELYWYFSKSQFYWSQANTLSSGSAQPHFNGKALKEVIFSYPKSIEEQEKLIIEFKSLLDEIEKLQTHYQHKLNNLEELKKSILQKAFAGELEYGL